MGWYTGLAEKFRMRVRSPWLYGRKVFRFSLWSYHQCDVTERSRHVPICLN